MFNWLKTKQVRNRIGYTLLILVFFKIGTYLTLPGVNIATQKTNNAFLTLFNLTSGSSLNSFGLFALGISPYITASIIFGIFAQGLIPYYKRLRDSGESGNIKIAQHTRIMTVFVGFLQALSIVLTPAMYTSLCITLPEIITDKIIIAIIMALGSLLVTYMAELIDSNGIGNGQGMIISTGIITTLPIQLYSSVKYNSFYGNTFWQSFYIMLVVFLFIIITSIIINKIEFKVQLQNLTSSSQTKAHYLPIKLLVSSVTPVIFASAILTLGTGIAQLFNKEYAMFSYQTVQGLILYTILIIFFSFVYNLVQVSGTRIAEDLNRTGMYISNIPPSEAKSHINKKVLKITLIGAPILALISGIAMGVELLLPVYLGLSMSGTSIFIVVGTLQETVSQIKGLTDKKNYIGIFDKKEDKHWF